jgi:hypothetical protein
MGMLPPLFFELFFGRFNLSLPGMHRSWNVLVWAGWRAALRAPTVMVEITLRFT